MSSARRFLRVCPKCGGKSMQKVGFASGKQLWRCTTCRRATVNPIIDRTVKVTVNRLGIVGQGSRPQVVVPNTCVVCGRARTGVQSGVEYCLLCEEVDRGRVVGNGNR